MSMANVEELNMEFIASLSLESIEECLDFLVNKCGFIIKSHPGMKIVFEVMNPDDEVTLYLRNKKELIELAQEIKLSICEKEEKVELELS